MRHVVGLAARQRAAVVSTVELAPLVQAAREIHFGHADAALRLHITQHLRELSPALLGRQPAQVTRQREHACTHGGLVGVTREVEEARARFVVVGDASEHHVHLGRTPRRVVEQRRNLLDAIQMNPGLARLALQHLVHEAELVRVGQALIGELAHVTPHGGMRIALGHTLCHRHPKRGEVLEQAATGAALSDLACAVGTEVTAQRHGGRWAKRRHRRKAVDHRDVLEHQSHAIAAALAVPGIQGSQLARSVLRRVPIAQQAAHDFSRRAGIGAGVERIAAEEMHLLQLGEQARAGVAARNTLELIDGQKFARLQLVCEELVAAVVVA